MTTTNQNTARLDVEIIEQFKRDLDEAQTDVSDIEYAMDETRQAYLDMYPNYKSEVE